MSKFDYGVWAALIEFTIKSIVFVFVVAAVIAFFWKEEVKKIDHSKNYRQTLEIAAEDCNLRVVKLLVESAVDIRDVGVKLLQYAAKVGCLEVMQFLLEKGVDINVVRDSSEKTVLHYAAEQGNLKVVKFLLQKGANPNVKERYGKRPRDLAIVMSLQDKSSSKPYKEITNILYDMEGRHKSE